MTGPFMFWVDLETTSIDPDRGHIAEVGVVVTREDLTVVDDWSAVFPMHRTEWDHLRVASPDLYESHRSTGLIDACATTDQLSCARVGDGLLDFLTGYMPLGSGPRPPMCGSSVHFDRAWLTRHLPTVANLFGYRNIDISTVRELAIRWRPDLVVPSLPKPHRALRCLRNTLTEASHYRDHLFGHGKDPR